METIVEDPRPNSGHMQVCNLSPISGYFDAEVSLGDKIKVGDPLGTVCDTVGSDRRTIVATQSGIVLVLRTFPRVHEGESVGVILEMQA